MRAVEFRDNELKLNKNYEKPTLAPNEAMVRIKYAGICNTDMELIKGYMGFNGILGHEFVGVVEDVNSDDKSLIGKRVVGEISAGCNNCEWCAKGLQRHCPNRKTIGIWRKDGCMADYINMPVETLFVVPDNLSDEEIVLVEPFAAALEILEQLHIKPMDRVVIMGDGKLGLSIAFALSKIPCFLTMVGKHSEKLAIAEKENVNTVLFKDFKIEKEYDVVIEATGSVNGFETALALTKPRGVLVLKSTVAADKPLNLAPVVIDEITVLGSRCGQFKPAINYLSKNKMGIKSMVSKIFKADDALEAFEYAKQKGVLKVLIDFS